MASRAGVRSKEAVKVEAGKGRAVRAIKAVSATKSKQQALVGATSPTECLAVPNLRCSQASFRRNLKMNRNLCTATALTALFLLSGPANTQTTQPAPEQPTTTEQTTTGQTTDTAVQATRDDDEMDWGWIGLLGLIGLAGLMRPRDPVVTARTNSVGSDPTRTRPRP